MGLAGDIRKRMERKRKELTELRAKRGSIQANLRETDSQIREVNAALAAYEEILRLAPADSGDDKAEPRAGSLVALAREALQKNGQAMHVGKLLEAMGKQSSSEQKVSLSSSLSAYVRKGQIFTKPEANTFGLREWSVSPETADDLATDQATVDEAVNQVAKASK
jgi:hypothetical protein